jgi:hypothetical protein
MSPLPPSILDLQWRNLPATALQSSPELRQQWDALNAAQGQLPFLASHAIVSALTFLGTGKERLLIGSPVSSKTGAVLDPAGGTVVAMLVLAPQRWQRWQIFQPSQLPLGAWVCLPHLPVLALARSVMRGPMNGPLGGCLTLSFTPLDPLLTRRPPDAPDSETRDYIDTAWVETQADFDHYWQARGKNLRHNLRKQRQRLHTEGITLSMQTLRQPEDMAAAVARYGALESQGWKSQQGTAIHDQNAQGHFYRALLEDASQHREAVVFQLLFDERVVAMNMGLQRGGTLVVLKTTYDESFSHYSPAFLLQETVLREFHGTQAIQRLEFFGRVMDWHTKWTQQQRTLYHLTLYRWPWLKQLALARRRRVASHTAKPGNPAVVQP